MASSQVFMAPIETNPQETEYCLVSKASQLISVTCNAPIIDAYSRAKEDKVGINSMMFSGLPNEQGHRGIAYWQAHWQ